MLIEQRKKVLCVDDEPDVTYRIKRFIERHYPIDVWTAGNGKDALDLLSQHDFDAALLDISMPGINGLEVASEIIRSYPKVIVIIITSSESLEVMSRARSARFLIKPVSIEEIRTLIYQHFGFLCIRE